MTDETTILIVLISHSCYQFSYTKQAVFLYTKIWVGCLNIIKSNTIFPVFNGLLTAQVFRKHAYHIISSNIFKPGLYIRKRTLILTLFKKSWNRSCKVTFPSKGPWWANMSSLWQSPSVYVFCFQLSFLETPRPILSTCSCLLVWNAP